MEFENMHKIRETLGNFLEWTIHLIFCQHSSIPIIAVFTTQIMENAEVNNLIKIMGLRYKEKYDSPESLKTLRYGKIMIMTDQDQDGSHIKGLLVNFIHHNWPGLLRHQFLEEFITPIVKVWDVFCCPEDLCTSGQDFWLDIWLVCTLDDVLCLTV